MKQYGLYVDTLPSNEASLLRSIIRLSSDLGGRWRVCDDLSDSDVLVVDADAGTDASPAAGRHLRLVTSRTWRDELAGAFLPRPFRADSIIAALGVLEAKLRVQPATSGVRRAKLKRWPSAHVSNGASSTLRMATVLSRIACSAPELAKRLALQPEFCEAFLVKLDSEGFLHWEDAASTPRDSAPEPPPPATVVSAGRRLLGAIRRRLGMSSNAG